MGWIAKLLGAASTDEQDGIRLDYPAWEVDSPRTFTQLFEALPALLPDDATLYFEDSSFAEDVRDFLQSRSVPEQQHLALGTIWPRPDWFHVPATHENLSLLANLMRNHANYELAVHFHAYRDASVLLQWHDVFDLPILLSDFFSEDQVAAFASALGTQYRASAV